MDSDYVELVTKKIPEYALYYHDLDDTGLFWEMIKMEIGLRQLPMQHVKQGKSHTKKSVYSHDLINSKNSYVQTMMKPLNMKWSVWKANLTLEECTDVLSSFCNDKTPGSYGLTIEF